MLKSFSYVAQDASGEKIKGEYSAENLQDFMYFLNEKGLFCINYNESEAKQSKSIYKFKTKDLAFDCRQLSAMMSSGLTLIKALDILQREQEKPEAKKCWRDIYENVQKGQSLSEALIAQNGAFPPFFISMVSAGESSGTLDTVMNRMSEHYAKENKLNNKVRGALTYPVVLMCVAVIVVIAMFTLVLPNFMSMFEGSTDLPALTKGMMKVASFFKLYWYIIVIIVAGLLLAFKYCMKIPSFRLGFDRRLLKSKSIGKLITKVYTGRFARTLSSLYSSGIPMVECLEKSSSVLGNSYITAEFVNVVSDVKQGEPISASIQKTGVFESMFCSIIYVGEESGALDDILAKTADYYEEEADSAISKLVGMLEPLMIVFLGVIIGLILAAIFPAMTASYKSIK